MNVLFLTQVLPYPLDAGPKVRAYHVLQQVARHHSVTLATFVRGNDPPEAIRHLEGVVSQLITCPIRRSRRQTGLALARSLFNGEPVLIARDRVAPMFAKLRRLVAEKHFDVIHADQLWMAPYALAAARAAPTRSTRPWLVLDQHNAVYLIPRRLMAGATNRLVRIGWQREAALMARYERRTCQAFDRVVTVTAEDAGALAGLFPAGQAPNFSVIPICIDPGLTSRPQQQPDPDGSANLLFMGGMHWPPNADGVRWFAAAILPAIRASQPLTRLLAVGRQPPDELRSGPAQDLVEAPGYVDDPQPYWARSQVFVVPLRAGGGMRVKILDAWARGVPVVSTTIGAEGLRYRPGDDILIADTPTDFAAAVLAVLTDAPLARRLATGGRATVEQHYDWRRIYPAWEQIYEVR
jgi:glycosyltransferase involved in cell wall biosynthesis